VAISIVAGMEQFKLREISRSFKIDLLQKTLPTDEDVEAIVSQRVTASLEAELRSRGSLELERMQRFIPLGRSLTEAEEDSPLIAMLLDDYYQRTLQAPPQPLPADAPVEKEAFEKETFKDKKKPRPRRPNDRPRRRGFTSG
jgi:ATP-dependent RNA helicase DeaD